MPDDFRLTRRDLPVIIGSNQKHVMATAEVFRTTNKVLIQINGKGSDGQLLAEFLEQAEPIALSFSAIPVQNIRERERYPNAKDQSYHEAAIQYNEGLAEFAENLAQTLGHPEIQRWCTAVGKQHRFHAKRHQSALNKIILRESSTENVENVVDGLDVPAFPFDPEENTKSNVEPVPEFSDTSVNKTEYDDENVTVFDDGCVEYHRPTDDNCEFYPKGDRNG